MKEKYFPVDIHAVKEYGIDKWHNEFFWPVSDKEFTTLCSDIEQRFAEQVETQPEEISDLFISKSGLRVECWHFLHAIKVINKIKSQGGKILYSDKTFWYKDIITGNFSVPKLKQSEYGHNPNWIYFTSQGDRLTKSEYNIPYKLKDAIKSVSSIIVDELKLTAQKNEITLSDNHIYYLRQLTQNELLDVAKNVYRISSKINKMKKKIHLLTQNIGNPLNNALCISIKKNGGKITGFSHTSAELFEKIRDKHSPLKNNQVVIKSADSSEYFKLWKRHGNKPLPSKINKIMLIGHPHNPWRNYRSTGAFSLMYLDLELRLVDILKKAGYEVFYKAHPDRVSEIKGIFDDKAKVLTKGYFQNYLDLADAFLFEGTKTTAFSIALCTNKPIIGFQPADELFKPFPEGVEILKKRCSFIYTRLDERNRIIFDEKELLDTMAQKPKQPNTEFIETYMVPEKAKI